MTGPGLVIIGSANAAKVSAVSDVLRTVGPPLDKTTVQGLGVSSGVGEQPREAQTLQGAITRAQEAAAVRPDALLAIGIEAGLFPLPDLPPSAEGVTLAQPSVVDIQYCAILDRTGHLTVGHGSGFSYPPSIMEAVDGRSLSVGDAAEEVLGHSDIGAQEGMIGYLTERRLDRRELTAQAVLMALVPRLRHELYGLQAPW